MREVLELMKRWVLIAALLLGSMWFVAGCGDGLMHSEEEWRAQREAVREDDMKQLTDDWNVFWLNERKARTTRFTRGD